MSTLKVFIKEYSEEMNKNFAPEKIDITRQVEFSVKAGYDFCQKEYEEKLRWIPVEEKEPPKDLILMKLSNGEIRLGHFSSKMWTSSGIFVNVTYFRHLFL